jgi:hypothetical protein
MVSDNGKNSTSKNVDIVPKLTAGKIKYYNVVI